MTLRKFFEQLSDLDFYGIPDSNFRNLINIQTTISDWSDKIITNYQNINFRTKRNINARNPSILNTNYSKFIKKQRAQ